MDMQKSPVHIKLVSNLITLSGIFCLVVALLLLINFIHIETAKPLESEALKSLVAQFQGDQQNEVLKQDIRNLDLLARKAFFTGQWQVRTGSYLLLFGGIVFAILLKVYHDMKARIGEPLITGGSTQIARLLSQRWILITGGLLFVSALAASFMTTDYLKIYEETGQVVQPKQEQIVKAVDVENTQGERRKEEGESEGNQDAIPQDSIQQSPVTSHLSLVTDTQPPVTTDASGVTRHASFRGHWGQGLSKAVNLPVDWDGLSGRNIKWKVALDKKGYNSPILWDDKLFIAGANAQARVIYCYDRNTGSLLWQHEASGIAGSPVTPPRVQEDTGLSAPTLATDGERVYGIFGTGDILATDMNGKRIWAKNLGVPDNHYGHSSSLICWKNKLIVQFDTNTSGRLLALDCATGEPVWNHARTTKISWASPVLAELNGKLQVITVTSPTVYGNDFETGAELWALDCLGGEVGPSAAVYDGLVYATNEYYRLAAIRPGPAPEIIWEADEYLPECSSPVAADGLLFVATSYGIFLCYDAKTGQKLWEHEYGQGFYGSPMIAEGRVYIMDRGGAMHIYKVDRTKTSLGDPVIGEKSVVTPAFADGAIYLRGEKTLFCVGK